MAKVITVGSILLRDLSRAPCYFRWRRKGSWSMMLHTFATVVHMIAATFINDQRSRPRIGSHPFSATSCSPNHHPPAHSCDDRWQVVFVSNFMVGKLFIVSKLCIDFMKLCREEAYQERSTQTHSWWALNLSRFIFSRRKFSPFAIVLYFVHDRKDTGVNSFPWFMYCGSQGVPLHWKKKN